MAKIKCPYCGHIQELNPQILLCTRCFEDISKSSEWRSARYDNAGISSRPASAAKSYAQKVREIMRAGRWMSPFGTILKRFAGRMFKGFLPLYFLSFFSLWFLMNIGVFTALIGVNIYYPEALPQIDQLIPVFLIGIAACLFVGMFCQAALIAYLANEQAGLMSSLAMASRKIFSYITLCFLLIILIWLGSLMWYLPGVMALILLSFSPFILISENESVLGAMRKNIRYVSDIWLPVLFRFLPLAIIILIALFLYAYTGSYILFRTLVFGTKNEFLYPMIASAIFSPFIVICATYFFTVYEDVRNAWEGPVGKPSVPEAPAFVSAEARAPELSPLSAYMHSASAIFRRRFGTLMALNILSYAPHVLQLCVLLAGYFLLSHLFDALGVKGQFGMLWFSILLKASLALTCLVAGGIVLFIILHLAIAALGFYLYIVLELAFVYAVADESLSARGALKKARQRFPRYAWVKLKADMTISLAWALIVPGVAFMAWYSLTPYVFALEGEENVAFLKSRSYVSGRLSAVAGRLFSIALLPAMLTAAVLLIIAAFLPFYWVGGLFLSIFSGSHLPGMYNVYSPVYWGFFLTALSVGTAVFYVPYQKVLLYVLYKDITER